MQEVAALREKRTQLQHARSAGPQHSVEEAEGEEEEVESLSEWESEEEGSESGGEGGGGDEGGDHDNRQIGMVRPCRPAQRAWGMTSSAGLRGTDGRRARRTWRADCRASAQQPTAARRCLQCHLTGPPWLLLQDAHDFEELL